MNKRRLERIAKFLEEIPAKNFHMGTFTSSWDELFNIKKKKDVADCGTTCCIAGWSAVLAGKAVMGSSVYEPTKDDNHSFKLHNSLYIDDAHTFAKEWLGLTEEQAEALFYRGNWPLTKTGNPKFPQTNKGAAKRIRYMIERGK